MATHTQLCQLANFYPYTCEICLIILIIHGTLIIDYLSIAKVVTPFFYTLLHILRYFAIKAEHLPCGRFWHEALDEGGV